MRRRYRSAACLRSVSDRPTHACRSGSHFRLRGATSRRLNATADRARTRDAIVSSFSYNGNRRGITRLSLTNDRSCLMYSAASFPEQPQWRPLRLRAHIPLNGVAIELTNQLTHKEPTVRSARHLLDGLCTFAKSDTDVEIIEKLSRQIPMIRTDFRSVFCLSPADFRHVTATP